MLISAIVTIMIQSCVYYLISGIYFVIYFLSSYTYNTSSPSQINLLKGYSNRFLVFVIFSCWIWSYAVFPHSFAFISKINEAP